jgi:hypothetical protein
MRSTILPAVIGVAWILTIGISYALGWQQRSSAELQNLKNNTCLARYFDGVSKGATYIYVGQDRCREIRARTGARPLLQYETSHGG